MARTPPLPTRRAVLAAGGLFGAAGLLGLPLPSVAGAASRRRFVFVFARGGWDTTYVFSPMGGAPGVDTEPDADVAHVGDLPFVDHASRPNVRAFFETYGHRAAVVDGMLVRSVNHAVCERLVLTGDARPGNPDWPSIVGSAVASEHALPNIVLSGPSEPGGLHRFTSIVGRSEQLQGLLEGSALATSDLVVQAPPPRLEDLVDQAVRDRMAARFAATSHPGEQRMLDAAVDGLDRMERLRADAELVQFRGASYGEQVATAVDVLRYGVARSVCLALTGFDTHARNTDQARLLDELFTVLGDLMVRLDTTAGRSTPTLAEETVVVVVSEMGRTPYLNGAAGKDHWPYTAAMVLGPGVRGGQRIGGYDGFLNGRAVDLATGALRDDGVVVTPQHLGATLLQIADVDPGAWLPGVPALDALRA